MHRILSRGGACVFLALLAVAATSATYVLDPMGIAGGGGKSQSTTYEMRGVVGACGGSSASTTYVMRVGMDVGRTPLATEAPTITSSAPTTVDVDVAYTYTVTATGSPTPTITASGYPAWLAWASPTLSGTPAAGDVGTTGSITITASNGIGADATETFTIDVVDSSTGGGGGGGGGCLPGAGGGVACLLSLVCAAALFRHRR